VAWTKVYTPTVNGGLGIIELDKFSRALRLRWLWYSWDDTSRPWKGLDLPIDNTDIALFNAATTVTLGNGNKATFWTSRWLQGEAPATLYPVLFKHSKRKNRIVQDALTEDKWIRDVDHNMSHQVIQEFVSLWERLQEVILQPTQHDQITWLHTSDGQYSASSAYRLQFMGTNPSRTADITWKTKAPPKCRFFTWLMLQNRIWTAARLLIRQWANDCFCQLCVRNLETVSHLFQECCYSMMIWDKVGVWISAAHLRPVNWTQIEDMSQWYADMGDKGPKATRNGVRSMIMLTTWELWKERNNRAFNRSSRTPEQLFKVIQDEGKN